MSDAAPLSGQTAWVTGSSRGLGRVMAEELCRLGADVAVHGTREDSPRTFGEGESMQQVASDVAQSGSGRTMAVWGDLTQESEVARNAAQIREEFGRIDLLVCCAGGDIGAGGTGVGNGVSGIGGIGPSGHAHTAFVIKSAPHTDGGILQVVPPAGSPLTGGVWQKDLSLPDA